MKRDDSCYCILQAEKIPVCVKQGNQSGYYKCGGTQGGGVREVVWCDMPFNKMTFITYGENV